MSKRVTIILAALNSILLVFIFFYERGQLSTSDRAGRSGHVLRSFVRDRVDRVELTRGDDEPIVFVRERTEDDEVGTWTLAGPIATAADDDAVDSFLGALEWLTAHRTIDEVAPEDHTRFGLDEPRFIVRFHVLDQSFELRVGGEAPTGEGIYASVEEEQRAFVIGEDFIESIDHDLTHFRSKELFDGFYASGAERVQLNDGERIRFERENDVWRLRAPGTGWASQGLVDGILRITRELTATRFMDESAEDLARFGLDEPWRELTVTRAEDASGEHVARLRVGAECGEHEGERYAIDGDGGPVVCVLVSDIDALEVDRERLREARLLTVANDAVEKLVLSVGERRLELRREEDGWRIYTGSAGAPGDPAVADDDAVAAWLTELRDTRAQAHEDLEGEPGHGLDEPGATLAVHRTGAEEPIALRFGDADEEGVWVRRGDEAALMRFGPMDIAAVDALRFRERELVGATPGDARQITIRRDGREERATRGEGGTWSLETPFEAEADRVVVRTIARQLATLRAERFITGGPEREHELGAEAPTTTVVYAPEEGDERTVTLRLGAETEGGLFAQLDGEDAVFVVSREGVDALTSSLVSLDLLTISSEGLAAIRLERGAEVVELTYEGGSWRTAGGAADAERTRQLIDRLGTLRAVGVLRYDDDALSAPAARVTVTQRGAGSEPVVLQLGATEGEGADAFVPMRREGLGVVYRVRPDTVRTILDFAP